MNARPKNHDSSVQHVMVLQQQRTWLGSAMTRLKTKTNRNNNFSPTHECSSRALVTFLHSLKLMRSEDEFSQLSAGAGANHLIRSAAFL